MQKSDDGDFLAALLDGDEIEPEMPKESQNETNQREKVRCDFCWIYTNEWSECEFGSRLCIDEEMCFQRKRERMEATRIWREEKEKEKARN